MQDPRPFSFPSKLESLTNKERRERERETAEISWLRGALAIGNGFGCKPAETRPGRSWAPHRVQQEWKLAGTFIANEEHILATALAKGLPVLEAWKVQRCMVDPVDASFRTLAGGIQAHMLARPDLNNVHPSELVYCKEQQKGSVEPMRLQTQ